MNYFKTLLFAAIALSLHSCASLTGYQDGRALGEEKGEVGVSFNVSQSPDFFIDDFEDDMDENFAFPNLELMGRYGVTDKFDVGVKLNTNLNLSVTSKYQLLGDQQSKSALAIGADVGTFGLVSSLWNAQLPLYFSLHPSDKFTWYLSPRYIFQFAAGDLSSNLSYLGGNTGLLFGRKNKFGFDLGYCNMTDFNGGGIDLLTIGIGGKFVFGGKDNEEVLDMAPEENKKPKRRKR